MVQTVSERVTYVTAACRPWSNPAAIRFGADAISELITAKSVVGNARKGKTPCLNVVPLGSHIVVRCLSDEEESAGGDEPSDGCTSTSAVGRVLSVGDGRLLTDGTRTPPVVQDGDRVLYDPDSAIAIVVDGEDLLIMSEHNVLATLS